MGLFAEPHEPGAAVGPKLTEAASNEDRVASPWSSRGRQTSRGRRREADVERQTSRGRRREADVERQTSRGRRREADVERQTSRGRRREADVERQTSRGRRREADVERQTSRGRRREADVERQTSRELLDATNTRAGGETMCTQVDKRWACGHVGYYSIKWCEQLFKGCKGTSAKHEIIEEMAVCSDCKRRFTLPKGLKLK
ncbi:hypothetical protein G6O67_008289 [Ophiocordyceps sinensis]|uniref:Uncharacterized protein n=1 Tax=Ophiocordyceps sinensis TaxID=72228 RepID=A0A8H4PKQ2_9HYPO|nr:hypothetical protein G6O67_008289 [Ophiocordyceps sinensis]